MEISALQKDAQSIPVAPASTPPEIVAQNRELIQAVKSVNAAEHFGLDNELTFVLDRHTQRPVIRVVNSKTKEFIHKIPPEYASDWPNRSASSPPCPFLPLQSRENETSQSQTALLSHCPSELFLRHFGSGGSGSILVAHPARAG